MGTADGPLAPGSNSQGQAVPPPLRANYLDGPLALDITEQVVTDGGDPNDGESQGALPKTIPDCSLQARGAGAWMPVCGDPMVPRSGAVLGGSEPAGSAGQHVPNMLPVVLASSCRPVAVYHGQCSQ